MSVCAFMYLDLFSKFIKTFLNHLFHLFEMWIFQRGVLNLTVHTEKSFFSGFDISFCLMGWAEVDLQLYFEALDIKKSGSRFSYGGEPCVHYYEESSHCLS